MKKATLIFALILCCISKQLFAQQRINPKQMVYIVNAKPNSILYRDTLYYGSRQFKALFYRTGDSKLIHLYNKHQSNKVWGNILTLTGSIASVFGVVYATSNSSSSEQKTTGWIVTGAGFACSVTGGVLMVSGQRRLYEAVKLFNLTYNKTAGIGISGNSAGLVVNF
jgi:hypothetical protein